MYWPSTTSWFNKVSGPCVPLSNIYLFKSDELKDVQFNVGRFFNISQSLVSKWLKQRSQIEENVKSNGLKRIKVSHSRPSLGAISNANTSSSSSSGGVAAANVEIVPPGSEGMSFDGALHNVMVPKKKGRARLASESEQLVGELIIPGSPASSDDE